MPESTPDDTEPTFDDNRHDQLTSAPKSTEADAEPRIETTRVDDETVRLDIRDDASARPGQG